jgi:hypothetical protein
VAPVVYGVVAGKKKMKCNQQSLLKDCKGKKCKQRTNKLSVQSY